jgi:hypothetical protein
MDPDREAQKHTDPTDLDPQHWRKDKNILACYEDSLLVAPQQPKLTQFRQHCSSPARRIENNLNVKSGGKYPAIKTNMPQKNLSSQSARYMLKNTRSSSFWYTYITVNIFQIKHWFESCCLRKIMVNEL